MVSLSWLGCPEGPLSPLSPKKSFLGSRCSYGGWVDGGGSAWLTRERVRWIERWRIMGRKAAMKPSPSIHLYQSIHRSPSAAAVKLSEVEGTRQSELLHPSPHYAANNSSWSGSGS
jgi:hypothetical protein